MMSETAASAAHTAAATGGAGSFCDYLAKQLIGRLGFSVGTVPEAEELAACDIVLTRHDGYPFTIVCLIDRERNPAARFDLPASKLEEIGRNCRKYSARLAFGTRMPVLIRIIEAGNASGEQTQRLAAYKPALFSGCKITAFAVDTAGASVVASSRLSGNPELALIEELLRSPRQSDDEIGAFVAVEAPPKVTPYLTFAILAALVLIFAAEIVFGIGPWTRLLEPSLATLVAFGGLQSPLVFEQGQWYRVFSAPLLHASAIHLLLNGFALVMAGFVLERFVGRLWLAALFVLGALGGAGGSLLTNAPGIVSVGASGAIMALFAAILVVSFRYPGGAIRVRLQTNAIQVLVPSLLPFIPAGDGGAVDYGAHAGGAVAGALAALALGAVWRQADPLPRAAGAALAIAVAGLVGAAWSGFALPENYRHASALASIIPQNELPKNDAEINQNAAALLAKYPRDPRSHYFQAIALLKRADLAGAERQLRSGLNEQYILQKVLTPAFHSSMQGVLAFVLYDQKRIDEAREVAKPVCQDTSAPLRERLTAAGLCTGVAR